MRSHRRQSFDPHRLANVGKVLSNVFRQIAQKSSTVSRPSLKEVRDVEKLSSARKGHHAEQSLLSKHSPLHERYRTVSPEFIRRGTRLIRQAQRLHRKNRAEVLVIVRQQAHETLFISSPQSDWITYCLRQLRESTTNAGKPDEVRLSAADPSHQAALKVGFHSLEKFVDDNDTLFNFEQADY